MVLAACPDDRRSGRLAAERPSKCGWRPPSTACGSAASERSPAVRPTRPSVPQPVACGSGPADSSSSDRGPSDRGMSWAIRWVGLSYRKGLRVLMSSLGTLLLTAVYLL